MFIAFQSFLSAVLLLMMIFSGSARILSISRSDSDSTVIIKEPHVALTVHEDFEVLFSNAPAETIVPEQAAEGDDKEDGSEKISVDDTGSEDKQETAKEEPQLIEYGDEETVYEPVMTPAAIIQSTPEMTPMPTQEPAPVQPSSGSEKFLFSSYNNNPNLAYVACAGEGMSHSTYTCTPVTENGRYIGYLLEWHD